MEEFFRWLSAQVSLLLDGASACIVMIAAAEAIYYGIWQGMRGQAPVGFRRQTWVRFGHWLLLCLQFNLAADIVRTAISPTWDDIGQLAAIAVIRTFLGYFLERDLKELNVLEKV